MSTYNALDDPYDKNILEAMRIIIHKDIVMKLTVLERKMYKVYFDPDMKNDLIYSAGSPIVVVLKSHPYDIPAVMRTARIAFEKQFILSQLRRTNQVVRQKDALLWYGVELEGVFTHEKKAQSEIESSRYETNVVDTIIVVEVKDKMTNRKARATCRRADAFTVSEQLIKQLRDT